jgi:hypothetical protein
MNWDNSTGLDAATEALLNNRIQIYLDEDSSASAGDDAQAAHTLILELYGLYKSASDPICIYKAQQEIIAKGKQWDTDDPAFAQIQKYVNRVLAGKFSSATDYLEKAIQQKTEVQRNAAADRSKEMGQSGANVKHANNNQVKANAIAFYLQNLDRYPTKKAAAVDLERRFPPLSWTTYLGVLKKY